MSHGHSHHGHSHHGHFDNEESSHKTINETGEEEETIKGNKGEEFRHGGGGCNQVSVYMLLLIIN